MSLAKWRPKWLPSLHDREPPRLWRIGYALAAGFAAAVAGLAVLWFAARAVLGYPHLVHSKAISYHDTVGVAQLVFASVAGAGALVALVVAYRRQRVTEVSSGHDRARVLNERFTAITTQLGDDQPAVRLAGVHAMAGLADDWPENRQTCVDVLCACLRIPDEPPPGKDADSSRKLAYRANREVRRTIIQVITAHLRDDAQTSWQECDLDFAGVVFDGGDFKRARFTKGKVSFSRACFSSGRVSFQDAVFGGSHVSFLEAKFYSPSRVSFRNAQFISGDVGFTGAEFSGGQIYFPDARFSGGEVSFKRAKFTKGGVSFRRVKFAKGELRFEGAQFSGGKVDFDNSVMSGGKVDFDQAVFSGGIVDLSLSKSGDRSHWPGIDWESSPPGVKLPPAGGGEPQRPPIPDSAPG
jgi:uncharacterized protein YjbI with pentapeptide repeats